MAMSGYEVIDPASGETLQRYPNATDAQMAAALASSSRAYGAWSSVPVAQRCALLNCVADLHLQRREVLARIINREMGKNLDAAADEVDFSAEIYRYYAQNAPEFLADEPVDLLGGAGRALIRRCPVGPLLGIVAANYPYYLVATFAAPNLAAGNTIVLKHAPQCPESAAAIHEIFRDAGFSEGAFVNVYATNDQVAAAIADPRIAGVSLTGSQQAGAAVAEIAGRHLKKVSLGLNGSDPFVVLSTHDLDAVVRAAVFSRTENSGQVCNAAKRFIVAADIYEEFLDRFTREMLQTAAELAPLSSQAAARRLAALVDLAVADGATSVSQGQRRGAWFPPTVLTDVEPGSASYSQEFFGPVAIVSKVSSEDEAVALANHTPFGLGAYVFTTDPEQGDRIASRIEAGMVYINLICTDEIELPFGGVKRSGWRRELGRQGIEEFLNRKLIRVGPASAQVTTTSAS